MRAGSAKLNKQHPCLPGERERHAKGKGNKSSEMYYD